MVGFRLWNSSTGCVCSGLLCKNLNISWAFEKFFVFLFFLGGKNRAKGVFTKEISIFQWITSKVFPYFLDICKGNIYLSIFQLITSKMFLYLVGTHCIEKKSMTFMVESQQSVQMSTEWTNEKHILYLNSIEASFVTKMHSHEYHMMDLRSWRLRKRKMLKPYLMSSTGNVHFPSGQVWEEIRSCPFNLLPSLENRCTCFWQNIMSSFCSLRFWEGDAGRKSTLERLGLN